MARARREMEGDVAAWLIDKMPVAILDPKALVNVELNPFREKPAESELMRKHKAKLAEMRFKAATEGTK